MKPAVLFQGLLLCWFAPVLAASDPVPGTWWQQSRHVEPWELDLDPDGDSWSTRSEYFAGTDPFASASRLWLDLEAGGNGNLLVAPSVLGATYALQRSVDLDAFADWVAPVPGTGEILEFDLASEVAPRAFFRLSPLAPTDLDGDGLSSTEEAMLGTAPGNADTDGDGFRDGREVLEYFTNPLIFDTSGGTITGVLRTDPNRDGILADGLPVADATVWLDADYDGVMDDGERRTRTDGDGVYIFPLLAPGYYHVRQFLEPGNTQTLPAEVTPPILDSWPDELVSYVHTLNGAAFTGAYGYAADRVWPGARFVIVGQVLETVDPSLILQPAGNRHEVPPIGIYNTTDSIALPPEASLTVRFDETIVDGPGNDLAIIRPTQGNGTELSEVWLGSTAGDLKLFGTIDQAIGGSVLGIDLAGSAVRPPVRFVKLVSKTNAGVDLGASFTALQALHYTGAATDARAVSIVGAETVAGMDFGRFFLDQPPVVLLEDGGALLRQGVTTALRLSAQDDIGITARSVTSNGTPFAVGADGSFSVTPSQPGILDLTGSATDTGGQVSTASWRLYIGDIHGELPFDPNTLGAAGDEGAPDIQVFAPAAGEVVAADTSVIATIGGLSAPAWEVAYAPVDLVDPYDLEAADPDYVPLAAATGYRTSEPIATFPGGTVANGIYFLRIKATPTGGGPTRYFGQVIAKGVDAATLQPRITLSAPSDGTMTGIVQQVTGSITSDRPLNEWFVEVAPREEVDLNDLGSDRPEWKRLAHGTTTVPATATLATLDSTVLPNGSYVIRVVAWNDLRLGRVEARLVEVTGEPKFGRHRREFTDVSIDLAGFPLVLNRIYDSFESDEVGDFGFGWSLSLVDPQIGETVPRTGSGIFGQTAYRDGTRIYLTGPDGRRNGFTFHPEFVSPGLFGSNYRATFTADPGCYDTLEIPEGAEPFLTVAANGDVKVVFLGFNWNPDTFVLVRPDGTRYTYHETSGFLRAEDLNGNSLAYTPAGFTHSGGMDLTFTRDGLGRITSVNAGGSRTWTYTYDTAGDLITVTDPDSRTSTYGYLATPAHYLAGVTDAFGRTGNSFEYDADGRLSAIVDPAGNRTLQSWDPLGFTGSQTDGRGNVTLLTYDQRGNLLTSTDPLGRVTRRAYADSRHPDKETSLTDPLNQVTRYTYDAVGNLIETVLPGGFFATMTTTWNNRRQPLVESWSDGRFNRWQYDDQGNVTQEELWQQPVRTFTHTAEGQVETITVAGVATRTEYDPATGLEAEITDPHGLRLTYTRNAAGELTGVTTSGGENITTTPGADGLPRTITDAAGASAGTVVNADGSITVNDWNGRNSRIYRDASGNTTALRGQDGFTVTPVLDANRNATAVTDALGNQHQMRYDPLNRLDRLTDPAGAHTALVRDALGRVTERTDRLGRKKRFTYNSFNQIIREQWFDPADAPVKDWSIVRSTHPLSLGRLDSISDGQSTWDFLGGEDRPSVIDVTYAGQARFKLLYGWGVNSGPTPEQVTVQSPTGLSTVRAPNLGGRVYQYSWDTPELGARHVRLHYDAMGEEIRTERYSTFLTSDINQVPFAVTHFSRDTKGRATQISHRTAAGALLFPQSTVTLGRSPGGCITSITEPGNASTMAYDAGLQLTGVAHSSRPAESYGYDAAGNRLTSHFQPVSATFGVANRLLLTGDLTLEYDAEGNLIRETSAGTGAIREFAYDHNNQMTQVQTKANALATPVVVATYAYDYAGRLISRTEGGLTTWILHDRLMPMGEFRSGETSLRRKYFYALDRLDRIFAVWDLIDGERWLLQDHRSSVRGVIRKDATPVVWADYDAFGQLISGDPALLGEIRFTGRFWSEAAQLYDLRARHYSPSLGRFLQQDPLGVTAGDLNVYRYAGNDPHNRTDPTGRVAALEYAADLYDITSLTKSFSEIGQCVCDMIGAAASGLRGVHSGSASGCVGDTLGLGPGDIPEIGFVGTGASGIKDLLDPPPDKGGGCKE